MNVDNSALWLFIENLQRLKMKDIAGNNVGAIISYLKGSLILLANCNMLHTNTMGFLRDTFRSAKSNKFTAFTTSAYFSYIKTNVIDYMEYVTLAAGEYMTLYRK